MARKATPKGGAAVAAPAPVVDDIDADLLTLTKAATRKEDTKKKEDRWEVVANGTDLQEDLDTLIRLNSLTKMLGKTEEQHEKDMKVRLLRRWVNRMWTRKSAPDNPRFILKKVIDGQTTNLDDMSLVFQVQFRSDGISVPSPDKLEPGQTAEDNIVESLLRIGLSRQNAVRFVKPDTGEVLIEQRVTLSDSFDKLRSSDDENKRNGIRKLMRFLAAEPTGKDEHVAVPALTGDERAACLMVKQFVSLKEGFFERAFTYCDDEEQLYKLLSYVKAKLAISNVEFGTSDKNAEKNQRLVATASAFIDFGDDEAA